MSKMILFTLAACMGLSVLISCKETDYYPRPPYSPASDSRLQLTGEDHPRLLMDMDDFEDLKTRVASGQEQTLSSLHNLIMRVAEAKAMAQDDLKFELDESDKRILTVSRNAILRIFLCSYAYRMTGDAKYLEHAEHDINTVCSFPSWNAKKHFLDVAEMATAVALGYDWLYNELSEATRQKALGCILDYAFSPAFNSVWNLNFYAATNNWNQVCNGGLICAALAIYESDPAACQRIIDKGVASNREPMKTMYSPDGNYVEGYGYWGYGTTYQCLMMAALESVTGSDYGLGDIAGFPQTGYYMQYMEGVGRRVFNYSDNGGYSSFLLPQWYFAAKYSDTSLLYEEVRKLAELTGAAAGTEERLLPMVMAFAKDLDIDNLKAPSKKLWSGGGANPVFIVKTGWGGDESDKYLAAKGGKASNSHGHMDAGSFVYDAYGVRWATDLGSTSYTAAEVGLKQLGGNLWTMTQESMRWDICVLNNKYHNTLTVNDARHAVNNLSYVEETFERDGEIGGVVNITPALSGELGSARRTLKIVGDRDLVVTDELTAASGKDAAVRWTMMTQAVPTLSDGRICLQLSGKTMWMSAASSLSPVSLKVFEQAKVYDFDTVPSGVYAVGFETTVPAGRSATLTVKLSPANQ